MRFNQFISNLTQCAQASNHRQLVVLAGDEQWAIALLESVIDSECCLWLGNGAHAQCVEMKKASSVLGREYATLVFNSYSGFNPDAFGQSVGTIAGGGICFLITPSFECWPDYEDPDYLRYLASPDQQGKTSANFITRLMRLIDADKSVELIKQHRPLPHLDNKPSAQNVAPSHDVGEFNEQQHAVEQIIKTVTGRRGRPLVMTADRGRGKSSALGIAAAQLLKTKVRCITVTAPNRNAVDSLFQHAMLLLEGATLSKLTLHWQDKEIRFIAPDELTRELPECQLLLVDEAAAIPTPMLTILAKAYSRIVFATTIHGYEGTGRGFSLRFVNTLSRISPGWRNIELKQPIRWAVNDPLESISNEMLGLGFDDVNLDSLLVGGQLEKLEFQQLTQQQLIVDEQLLSQIFNLLVIAHYQTSPSDFRQLLDAPQLSIFAAFYQGNVVATALVLREGELSSEINHHILQGTRRLRGHLLAQSLVAQMGLERAGKHSYARVMRIAVNPQLQIKGIGKSFEQYICAWAAKQGIDFIGASFGATASLSCFWFKQGYHAARLGTTKDRASGTHSLLVLKSLQKCPSSLELIVQARDKFAKALRYSLSGKFNNLEPALVNILLHDVDALKTLSDEELLDINNYATTDRPFEQVDYLIEQLIWCNPADLAVMTVEQQQLVISKVLQQRPWNKVVSLVGAVGKKQVKNQLKQAVIDIINVR